MVGYEMVGYVDQDDEPGPRLEGEELAEFNRDFDQNMAIYAWNSGDSCQVWNRQ